MEKIIYSEKSYYIGETRNGNRNGYGTLYCEDGTTFEGNWVDNLLEGRGERHFKDGGIFYGNWKKFICNGIVQMCPPGQYKLPADSLFVDGKCVKNGMFYDAENLAKNPMYESGYRIYHGGLCSFILETPSVTIILDWYGGILPKLREDKPVVGLYSHIHFDHFSLSPLEMLAHLPNLMAIFLGVDYRPDSQEETRKVINEIKSRNLKKIIPVDASKNYATLGDINLTVSFMESNDWGVAYLIKVDGKTFFHSGDLVILGYGPTNFHKFVKMLNGKKIDYAMLSMGAGASLDLGLSTLQEYHQTCDIRYFTPMHLWSDYKSAWEILKNETNLLKSAIGVGFDEKTAAGNLPLCTFYKLPL